MFDITFLHEKSQILDIPAAVKSESSFASREIMKRIPALSSLMSYQTSGVPQVSQ